MSGKDRTVTSHRAHRIKQTILHKGFLHAILIALPSAAITATYGAPAPVNPCAAARKEEIIVEFVFVDCRTSTAKHPCGSPFDRNDDR